MKQFKTAQEDFWAGKFGNDYIERNKGDEILARKIALFSTVFRETAGCKSVIEFGSNVGLNLLAIKMLKPTIELSAVEINEKACRELRKIKDCSIYNTSLHNFKPKEKKDLVLISGVLIHLNPRMLPSVYSMLYESSNRYICLVEYYNPKPVAVVYRGNKNRLFKRDFAGEFMDKYNDLKLVNYGFTYHRDNNFPSDDSTWFLLEK
ncbi:MAG: pseudaminic acid biosynthesis-associated methylase [Gammaproteobacteria bacterium]